MNNIILNKVKKEQGDSYSHTLEVESTYEIEYAIELIAEEFKDDGVEALKEFFNSMSIIYLNKKYEDSVEKKAVYNFNTDKFIDSGMSESNSMKKADIEALKTRFEVMYFLLIGHAMFKNIINTEIESFKKIFNAGKYQDAKKSLDSIDSVVLDILSSKLNKKPFDNQLN